MRPMIGSLNSCVVDGSSMKEVLMYSVRYSISMYATIPSHLRRLHNHAPPEGGLFPTPLIFPRIRNQKKAWLGPPTNKSEHLRSVSVSIPWNATDV